jgi:thiaminase (transcriptional activator TenA)
MSPEAQRATNAFSDELLATAARGWELYLGHPFFADLADGTLSHEQLRFWLEQDLPYVAEYARARAVLAMQVRADYRFGDLVAGLEGGEWESYAGELEIGFELGMLKRLSVEVGAPSRFDARPAREGYMNHVARAALEGDIGEIVCALLPCEWGFTQMGAQLGATRAPELDDLYESWIDYYTSPEQLSNTELSLAILERAAEVATDEQRDVMRIVFRRSVQHQLAVLDAAHAMSDPWPDEVAAT